MTLELFGVTDEARLAEAIAIRFAVFVDEQGVPAEEELDEHDRDDADAVHALVRAADGRAVAAGRYYRADAQTAQVGRMAVRREARGIGAGALLLDGLLARARARGFVRAALNAQDHAVGFYARAGFGAAGPTMLECGIVHQPMVREPL